MTRSIYVEDLELGCIRRLADKAMVPVMRIVSGTFVDCPQQTHFWNNTKLQIGNITCPEGLIDGYHLKHDFMVFEPSVTACRPWIARFVPLFHIPIFGGWKEYVVIAPVNEVDEWYVGWVTLDLIGISRIKLGGPVVLLRGPAPVYFFGINGNGVQIKLWEVGHGVIGKESLFSHLPHL